jgi:glycosyltransferase involved in cell wall biosynthesis
MFAQLAMRRRAARSSVRAVHITDPDALITLGTRNLLTTVYDLIPLKEGISRRRFLAWFGYRSYLGTLRRAGTLFAISNQTATDVENLLQVPRSRIVVAPPGIEPRNIEPTPDTPIRPYFLFIGGPNPNKNLGLLLDAMVICSDLAEELLIAGHWLPKQVMALKDEVEKRGLIGRVRHLRFVSDSDLTSLMRSATAVVIPSLSEGFGLPVGEGLAVGAAVIHSRIPVLDEVSEGAALTFDPYSADELASRMREVARDEALRNRLRQRGRDRAKLLTWDAAVARTLATYEAVLAN